MRRLLALAATIAALGGSHAAAAEQHCQAPRLCLIHQHRDHANALRHRLGQRAIPYHWLAERYPARRVRILRYWQLVDRRTRHRWARFAAAITWSHGPMPTCIRGAEGSYTSVNPNGHYGAYQADGSFELAYNKPARLRWGHANHWPAREQHLMAYHGYQARGYSPWVGDGCVG